MSISGQPITILSESESWNLLASAAPGRVVTGVGGQPVRPVLAGGWPAPSTRRRRTSPRRLIARRLPPVEMWGLGRPSSLWTLLQTHESPKALLLSDGQGGASLPKASSKHP